MQASIVIDAIALQPAGAFDALVQLLSCTGAEAVALHADEQQWLNDALRHRGLAASADVPVAMLSTWAADRPAGACWVVIHAGGAALSGVPAVHTVLVNKAKGLAESDVDRACEQLRTQAANRLDVAASWAAQTSELEKNMMATEHAASHLPKRMRAGGAAADDGAAADAKRAAPTRTPSEQARLNMQQNNVVIAQVTSAPARTPPAGSSARRVSFDDVAVAIPETTAPMRRSIGWFCCSGRICRAPMIDEDGGGVTV